MSASAEVKVTRHPSAELTDDMTVADLLDVLEHLPLGPRGGPCMLQLDRGVRDYLLRALRRQRSEHCIDAAALAAGTAPAVGRRLSAGVGDER